MLRQPWKSCWTGGGGGVGGGRDSDGILFSQLPVYNFSPNNIILLGIMHMSDRCADKQKQYLIEIHGGRGGGGRRPDFTPRISVDDGIFHQQKSLVG